MLNVLPPIVARKKLSLPLTFEKEERIPPKKFWAFEECICKVDELETELDPLVW